MEKMYRHDTHWSLESVSHSFLWNSFEKAHIYWILTRPCQKLGNLRNLGYLGNLFPRFFNPSFPFCPTAKIENSEISKLRITRDFQDFWDFRVFNLPFFHFSKKTFFNILKCSKYYHVVKRYICWEMYLY